MATVDELSATLLLRVQEQHSNTTVESKDATKASLQSLLVAVSSAHKVDLTEAKRATLDGVLVEHAVALKWPLLHTLCNPASYRALLGLPQTLERTRRHLTTISPAKTTELLSAGLSCHVEACGDAATLKWVEEVLHVLSGAGRFKKDLGGCELKGPNKQTLKTVMNKVKKRRKAVMDEEQAVARRSSSSDNKTKQDTAGFIDRDFRVVEREREASRASALASMVDQAIQSSSSAKK